MKHLVDLINESKFHFLTEEEFNNLSHEEKLSYLKESKKYVNESTDKHHIEQIYCTMEEWAKREGAINLVDVINRE